MKFYRDLWRAQAYRRNKVIFKLPIYLFFLFASSKLKQGFQTGVFSRKKYSLILTVNGKLLDDLRRRKPEGDWGQVC